MNYKLKISQLIVYFYFVIGAFSIISINFYRFYRNYGILFGIIIIICCLWKRKFHKNDAFIVIITLLYFIFNILLVMLSPSSGIGSTINILILIYLHMLMKRDKVHENFINIITILYAIECLYYFFVSKNYGILHYESIVEGNSSYINPNFIAYIICIMSFQIWAVLQNINFKNNFIRLILNIFFIILNIATISNLDSRTSYIAMIVFYLLVYFYPIKFITKKKIILVYIFFIILSITVVILYVYMYKKGISINNIGSITKRTYTGREIIWQNYLGNFYTLKDWIIGLGSKIKIEGSTDMHNMTLSLIKNGGIISALLVYGYIGREIIYCFKERIVKKQFIYLAGVLSAFIIGCFESIFLSSQFFSIFILLLYQAREINLKCNK